MKLFLKGDRCFTDKCSIERRNYPPGQHGQGRPKFSDYGLQLREKQKVRRIYGLLERQFRKTVAEASRMKGVKGENLMALLERRLDNVIFRLGFVTARTEARQLVRHGHFAVNGKRVDIPSYRVRKGDKIELTARGQKRAHRGRWPRRDAQHPELALGRQGREAGYDPRRSGPRRDHAPHPGAAHHRALLTVVRPKRRFERSARAAARS
jgi:small subunit ribosomal protein S4